MVHCAAINCTNSSSKKSDNTFSFFKIPKDPNRRKVCIAKLKRANLSKDENLHVHHEHFEENWDLRVSYIFLIDCLLAKHLLDSISATMHFILVLTWNGYSWNHLFVFMISFSLGQKKLLNTGCNGFKNKYCLCFLFLNVF